MLDPTIRDRVAELEAQGVRRGDAIGIAAHEQRQKENRETIYARITTDGYLNIAIVPL